MSEILLGVGGGIAAYKSCDLLRRLQERGHNVTVVPTPASLNFVGRATWEALSGKPVHTEVWEAVDKVNHVKIGDKSDFIIIAPATADLIARIAHGRADDLLTNAILASSAPKLLVPAMHPKMWLNQATQANIEILKSRGFVIMQPDVGRLTGSDSGIGRLPEAPTIIEEFVRHFEITKDLSGKKILITAGGTKEDIDDVRFIGNRSSGRQGLAIARSAQARGALVTLIAANLETSDLPGINVIPVRNTEQLGKALSSEFDKCDVLIMAAAVSDVRPEAASGKIKKNDLNQLNLIKNPDLLQEISKIRSHQLLVGFAAEESENLLGEGRRKLHEKNLDMIYANDIRSGAIFGSDSTSGVLIDKDDTIEVSNMSKVALAGLLLDVVSKRLQSPNV